MVKQDRMTKIGKDMQMSSDSNTVPTHDMIKNLTEYIVNGMSFQELTQHVYDDIYSLMLHDADLFHANLESLDMKPEDFNYNDDEVYGVNDE